MCESDSPGKTVCRYNVNYLMDYFVCPDRAVSEDLLDHWNLNKLCKFGSVVDFQFSKERGLNWKVKSMGGRVESD